MMRKVLLLLMVIMLWAPGRLTEAAERVPEISVGLWVKQTNAYISSETTFTIYNAGGRKVWQKLKAGTEVFIEASGGKIMVNHKAVDGGCIIIANDDADKGIKVNRRLYRGRVKAVLTSGKLLNVINLVSLEDYLYGVVPKEMSPSWPAEAVKAQAVVARTFALANLHKHESEGYQLCATTNCQVYAGMNDENELTSKAVDDTRGMVLISGGEPINSLFHSSSGGKTENSEDVWGKYLPYLRSVPDYDQETPYYSWEKKYTQAELTRRLINNGHNIGELKAIELSPLKEGAVMAADRTKSGRVKQMRFIGTRGNVLLSGQQVRTVLGLNSTMFDFELYVDNPKKIDVPLNEYYKKKIEVNVPPYKEGGWLGDSENVRRFSGREAENIVIKGHGFGHGLGLSQWGAKVMAERDGRDYINILLHYYTDIALEKMY